MPYYESKSRLGILRFGFAHDLVEEADEAYLERWIIWCGFSLRIHKFHKGDDDRAFHDHPWWFITFPLTGYTEFTPNKDPAFVKPWRFYFRSSSHRHIVKLNSNRPVWTLILTGKNQRTWGFWENDRFSRACNWLASKEKPNHTN
jgi:hypothetical protein